MELSYEIAPTHPQVTVLHVSGKVDGSNYIRLIEKVQTLCGGEARHLLLDLKDCLFLSSAGLFALHSIALITHHAAPPDPANGWGALHQMANAVRSYKENFKLAGLQPNVLRTLEVSGFLGLFAIYPDLPSALEAFGPAQ